MKIKVLLLITLTFTLALSPAADMNEYLDKTQALTQQGMYKEALERHIWFHNHALEHDPAMYGVRLSFALYYWRKLGEQYPPAMAALKETRDTKTKAVLTSGTLELFIDVSAINRELGEIEKTVALFDQLDRTRPEFAEKCWDEASRYVLEAGRVDLMKKYLGDPYEKLEELIQHHEQNKERLEKLAEEYDISTSLINKWFVEETLRLIEMLEAIGNTKDAKAILIKAYKACPDERLKNAM